MRRMNVMDECGSACVVLSWKVVVFRRSTGLEELARIEIGEWSSMSVFNQVDSSHSQSGGYQLAGTPRWSLGEDDRKVWRVTRVESWQYGSKPESSCSNRSQQDKCQATNPSSLLLSHITITLSHCQQSSHSLHLACFHSCHTSL